MRNRLSVLLTAFVLAVSLAVTGCGGDDDSDAAGSSAPDNATIVKADFIQAANTACEERAEQMKGQSQQILATAAGKSRNTGAEELIEKVIAPGFEREARDLRALEPPPGDEEQVNELITAIEEMVERMQSDLSAGRNYPYRKTENLAAAYGLPACGTP